ncbi:UDP-N-acetylglucosamine 1-carboxyvinyltransferase [Desulfuribacillus alkaliarsenatis]|uniref:UDP-N-acetylglucosamine 1-carboxyvinyltransferase n=1 Tax=Desulfuribacillus alkaliarsenatis TaxID=766136 RepID=A0A1E5G1G4_9FIRM|nr:UDP-N-acetylglucosamine 1-carboxyvinyltransferase [Desulfuribacillus alkaliarsenatis]OEF96759.1 UDP-N-acetylglucosamine 1-carboxyvinyltransferase [Desulfuribacillus alkaliarsenatis]
MELLSIRGGRRLQGTVTISGAKNSAVALIPASILGEDAITIENLPNIRDVGIYKQILEQLDARVVHNESELIINPAKMVCNPVNNGLVTELRASYYLMGAMLGKFGESCVGLPGGCNLGPRPIDQHLKGFQALGASIEQSQGMIYLKADKLIGAKIYLDVVSVGATINIMLAAVKAKGQTIIENAAKEPEIIDIATILTSMGAKIKGAGTDIIKITGVESLGGCKHSIIPDRIEAGTYMIAAAATKGEVIIDSVIPKHLEPITAKLREIGVVIEEADDQLLIRGKHDYRAVDVKTLPYPGFPTDLQQPITTLLTQANGCSIVTDNIYGCRFKHIDELKRMGANVKVEGRSAVIEGSTCLQGASVRATDLRAGAALVVAGLCAEGTTSISGIQYIDRGYERIEDKLTSLGAEVWREQTDEQSNEQSNE